MISLKSARSIGYVEYGNNNFWEVMVGNDGVIAMVDHNDGPGTENPDGTWDCEGISIGEFADQLCGHSERGDVLVELGRLVKGK